MRSSRKDNALSRYIYQTLKDRILDGTYGVGEKLHEEAIAKELKVSRTPLRAAFSALQEEDLVEYIPKIGRFSKGMTHQDIDDIWEIRRSLEILAVEWAVERIDTQRIIQLKQLLALMNHYIETDNLNKAYSLNADFHNVIYSTTGSRFLTSTLEQFREYIAVASSENNLAITGKMISQILVEHHKILLALVNKNADAAAKAMDFHIRQSKKRWMESSGYKKEESI